MPTKCMWFHSSWCWFCNSRIVSILMVHVLFIKISFGLSVLLSKGSHKRQMQLLPVSTYTCNLLRMLWLELWVLWSSLQHHGERVYTIWRCRCTRQDRVRAEDQVWRSQERLESHVLPASGKVTRGDENRAGVQGHTQMWTILWLSRGKLDASISYSFFKTCWFRVYGYKEKYYSFNIPSYCAVY